MPAFSPRNRVQILRGMIARVVARSAVVGLTRNSVVYHILAAASEEDAEQYFEAARLRSIFSIDTARGSDLDERAKEIQPGDLSRVKSLFASTTLDFSRPGTAGNQPIGSGTIVAGSGESAIVRFRTTAPATILDGNSTVTGVPAVALEAGSKANLPANAINQFITRVPGVTTVSNPGSVINGRDRESDENYVSRLKAHVQAISRGTATALIYYATSVSLPNGSRVLFAKPSFPVVPTGRGWLYIDDGTGFVETYSDTYLSIPETLIASAGGGETRFQTAEYPIRNDGTFVLRQNGTSLVEGSGFFVDRSRGLLELTSGLGAGDSLTAEYRHYTGLIQEVQKVIVGNPEDTTRYPGVQCEGIQISVLPPQQLPQTLSGVLFVSSDFDRSVVRTRVRSAIQSYINSLNLGANVLVAEIYDAVMAIPGVANFRLSNLSGTSPPADQQVLDSQVARIQNSNITLN